MRYCLFLLAIPAFADIASWQNGLPSYESRCAAVETRMGAIANPNSQQQDTIVQARAWCRVLVEIRNAMVTNPAYFNSFSFSATKAEHWTSGAEYFAGKAEQDQDPFAGAYLYTRAFKSVMDNSYLYYVVKLPSSYSPPASYGADIYLHSGGQFQMYWGNTATALSEIDGVWVKPTATPANSYPVTDPNRFWVKPSCRGENDYKYLGQAACDEEIAHFMSQYSVNPDRVVVGGGSAGGAGTMRYISIRPDLAAAAYNMTGGVTYGWGSGANTTWYNWTMQDNFSTTPLLHWTCPQAQESNRGEQRQSMDYFDTLTASYPGTYLYNDAYDANPACSHVRIQEPVLSQGWTWLRSKVRNMWPDRVIFRTLSLGAINQMKWVAIDTTTSNALATVNAYVNRANNPATISVALASNIDRITLNLSTSLLQQTTVSIEINGTAPLTADVGGEVHFWRTSTVPETWAISANRYPAGPLKKKGVSGPLADFFMQVKPIYIVYGTAAGQSDAAQLTLANAIMDQFFGPTINSSRRTNREFTGRFLRDADVTQAHADTANLILIGSKFQNSYVDQLSSFGGGLPIAFPQAGQFRINNSSYTEGQYRCQSSGALNDPQGCTYVVIFPNPRNQNNYILLVPESYKFPAWKNIDTTNIMVENADALVGYLNNYPQKVLAMTFPQDWGTTASGAVTIAITAVGASHPTNPAPDETIMFTAVNGTAPHVWSIPGCGAGSYTGNPVTCSYASTGTRGYSVTDSLGNTGSGTITIVSALAPVSVSPAERTDGVNTTLTWTVSGGSGPYSWSAPSCSPDTGAGTPFSCSYPSAGSYTITATDSTGSPGTAAVTITSPPAPVVVSPGLRTETVNTALTWTVSGGTGPYSWSAPSCSPDTGTGPSFSCSYTIAGNYTVTASDSAGGSGSATAVITNPPPPVVVSPASRSDVTDTMLTWTVSGGTGSYTWSAPGCWPDTGAGPSFSCSYSLAGDYTVTGTDSANNFASAAVTVSQPYQPPAPGAYASKVKGRAVIRGRVKTK